jgi:hypothetical protein
MLLRFSTSGQYELCELISSKRSRMQGKILEKDTSKDSVRSRLDPHNWCLMHRNPAFCNQRKLENLARSIPLTSGVQKKSFSVEDRLNLMISCRKTPPTPTTPLILVFLTKSHRGSTSPWSTASGRASTHAPPSGACSSRPFLSGSSGTTSPQNSTN